MKRIENELEFDNLSIDDEDECIGLDESDLDNAIGSDKEIELPDGNIEDLLYEKFDVNNVNAVEMSDDFKEQNEECSENNNPKPARVFNFKIHEDDFKIMVDKAFQEISDGLIEEHKFSSQLTSEQRKVIHERATSCGFLAVSKGTKYRCLYLTKNESVSNKSIERNPGYVEASESLKELTNSSIPRDEHVDEILKDNVSNEQKNDLKCELCEKLCKGDQGLKVHMAWHRKKLKK